MRKRPEAAVLVATTVLALLLFLALVAEAGGTGQEETPAPEAQEEVDTRPVDPWTDPAYRAKVRKAYRTAVRHQRATHVWSHKLGRHGKGTHARLVMSRNLRAETRRANYWKRRATQARKQVQACTTRPLVPASVRVKGASTSLHQRRNITTALNIARKRDVPENHRIALIAAATQEQSTNNKPYGHGTSVGFLQLINIHGTVAWRMDMNNSVGWFLNGARKVDPNGRMAPGTLAQAVQRSAHPDLYHQWVPEARRTYRQFLGGCPPRVPR